MVVSETDEKNTAVAANNESGNTVGANTVAPGRPDSTTPATVAVAKDEVKTNEPTDESVRTEHLFKHPLQNTWTLWYLENDRTKSWEDMQNEITSFDTVEDFWSLYNHIKPPSDIKLGSDYSLFKKGIRPMWEDAANKQGGRWVITLNKNSKNDLDNLWLDVLLCLIGEAFDHSDQICGAVVNIRGKSNKISIWTANGNNEEAALEIGHKLRDALRLGRQNLLQYQLHKDTMVKQGSNVKSIYTL
ncbi:eukaryotic translation initiation factor 4E1 isoform X2 [Scaptodrosophila lebanonensis]|uniref:eIF-4F 25 kDa subunit n=1 Tax=Drosophila lebanonensis TaxID=7225 RepID=A0A6J2T9K3_DROLE|nr:eukaryotic translation initiation factor 4E1 isoform X2 [Scaptodrosophila lebanonensis]